MNILTAARTPSGSKSSSGSSGSRTPAGGGSGSRKPKTDRRHGERRQAGSDRRAKRVFFRGTNLQPTGEKLQPCLIDSKQSILVDLLRQPEGATMEELLLGLAGGKKPWTEATVRSGFGWDLKRKGYGVRSEFDAEGEERFHLIVPKGQKIPAHVTREQARKGNGKAPASAAKKDEPAKPQPKKATVKPARKTSAHADEEPAPKRKNTK